VNAQVGARASLQDLRESVVMPTSAITLLLPISQTVVFYLLPILYNGFLPKYRSGLECAQILILGAFFVGLIRNGANYLIAVDKQMALMGYVVASVAVNAGASVALARLGFGINGIAFAASGASALLASLIWGRVLVELGYDRKNRLSLLGSFYIPFLGTLFAIAVVRLGILKSPGLSPWLLHLQMLLALCICCAVIFAFPSTRAGANALYRRVWFSVVVRFKKASAL
jgi:O-antigen/teichoic acid export membrane protein